MNSFSALFGCNHVLCIHKYIPVLKCKLHTAEDFTFVSHNSKYFFADEIGDSSHLCRE